MPGRTIFHLDLDAFFVSVERILDPSLENKPVIVGGDPRGRGVVAACSYEARKFGLHSAMPINKAFQLCPQGIYLHGHYKEYVRYSKAVKTILEKYAPALEQASVDEFYLDLTGCERIYGHPYLFASALQVEIKKTLGLPCSIGIASNKYVAKIASDYAKPNAITYVCDGQEEDFLAPLPVEALIGVGHAMKKELNAKGFYKTEDIASASPEYMQIAFGKSGYLLWEHAHGMGSEYLTTELKRKSIGRETTYDKDTPDKKFIESTLLELTADVCNTMRQKHWQTKTIGIKLRYSDFVTLTRAKTLAEYTSDDKVIYETGVELFRKGYTRRVSVRLIGIHLTNFAEESFQEILFPTAEDKRKKVFSAMDNLRQKYGLEIIKYGIASREENKG